MVSCTASTLDSTWRAPSSSTTIHDLTYGHKSFAKPDTASQHRPKKLRRLAHLNNSTQFLASILQSHVWLRKAPEPVGQIVDRCTAARSPSPNGRTIKWTVELKQYMISVHDITSTLLIYYWFTIFTKLFVTMVLWLLLKNFLKINLQQEEYYTKTCFLCLKINSKTH